MTTHLAAQAGGYDLVVCADTLCYFGDLDAAIGAAGAALAADRLFVSAVERATEPLPEAGYLLAPNGRYVHAVRDLFGRAGFKGG